MAKAVEVTVRVADLKTFSEFVSAAGEVLSASRTICGGEETDLSIAIKGLREAMERLSDDDQ